MKNNLLCIDNLISNTQLDEAHKICQNLTDKYSSIGSVVNLSLIHIFIPQIPFES